MSLSNLSAALPQISPQAIENLLEEAFIEAQRRVEFARTPLRVKNKRGQLEPLVFNKVQQHLLDNLTGRDLVLKARQVGVSTAIQAHLFRACVTESASTITLCHESELTSEFRERLDRFYDNMPESLRPARKIANASVTTYPDFDSRAFISTVGGVAGKTKARGMSATHFHGSEVAYWHHAADVVAGAMQAGNPAIILESSPNGAHGWFYEKCMKALDGDPTWKLHFYPWWWDDGYQIPLDNEEQILYTEEEQILAASKGLTPEQIKWRRVKSAELGRLFAQEYPENPRDCFLLWTGRVYPNFDVENVTKDAEYKPGLDLLWGVDDGYVEGDGPGHANYHPRVVLLGQPTPNGGLNIFAEYFETGIADYQETITVCATENEEKGFVDRIPDLVYYDSSAAMFGGALYNAGLYHEKATHRVVEGIRNVRRLICDGQGVRLIRIHPRCKNLIREMTSYRYDAKSNVEKPSKIDDHGPDALRYMARHLWFER